MFKPFPLVFYGINNIDDVSATTFVQISASHIPKEFSKLGVLKNIFELSQSNSDLEGKF